ncbi:hypothetical protein KZP23_02885 [Echinicola marina]|uniref:ParM/StbA family protein n=1 Tax=Echinicola marina TaxID=2859768 RepID=UPI001CF624DB|nr:hypothetical protein [Echinicola marina]UCS93993.1 hypothetical protein KZP23_02885 [Echinicola marina]
MIVSEQIPSVIESNNVDLRFVAKDLTNGLKLYHENQAYIIGELALSEGISPHKNINSSPQETDYNLLLKSALLLSNQKLGNPVTVTTGFPFSTFQLYKQEAMEKLEKDHIIEYETGTFSNGGRKKLVIEVDNAFIMPEVVGCSTAVRNSLGEEDNFFMVSIGYGTFEAILSTRGGLVQRSSVSTYGIRYAVKLMEAELLKSYYLDLKNEHQLDQAFSKGFIFLNRRRIDLGELRKIVIKQYYEDVVSPALRKAFDDSDFAKTSKIYLAGGGAGYPDLLNAFKQEFDGILDLFVPENASVLAATGYLYNSLEATGGDKGRAVGIDIGNATTVISNFQKDNGLMNG